jgi:hypothetical protein
MTVTDVSADFSDLKTNSVSLFMHLVEGFLLRQEGLQGFGDRRCEDDLHVFQK